jgi:hypothetical protein
MDDATIPVSTSGTRFAHPIEGFGVRLYCIQGDEVWGLQVRGPQSLRTKKASATGASIMAHARMTRADLEHLRALINEALGS